MSRTVRKRHYCKTKGELKAHIERQINKSLDSHWYYEFDEKFYMRTYTRDIGHWRGYLRDVKHYDNRARRCYERDACRKMAIDPTTCYEFKPNKRWEDPWGWD
mgnify:FL=1|tara:strand:+ start:2823 stop:3131 length:309 start_codon:yes stop_codon:yes gene_type:complete